MPSTPNLTPELNALAPASDEGLRLSALIAYGLFGLALFNGVTAIIGVVLAYVKRSEAKGTVWESHCRNLITVFWAAIILAGIIAAVVVPSALGLVFTLFATKGHPPVSQVGWLIAMVPILIAIILAFAIWYFYRVIRGFLHAIEARPY